MWDLPRPEIEPVSPALAGPGKSQRVSFKGMNLSLLAEEWDRLGPGDIISRCGVTQSSDTLGLLDAWGRCVCAYVRMCRHARVCMCVCVCVCVWMVGV